MKGSFLVIALLLSLMPGDVNARDRREPTPKPAWEWTNADRLAVRFDRARIRERVMQAESDKPPSSQSLPHAGEGVKQQFADVIDGRRHPELFFPHELFEPMMKFAFVLDDPDYRAHLSAHAAEVGLPADFWNRLRDVSASYIDDLRQKYERIDRLRHASPSEVTRLQSLERASAAARCSDRAAALKSARKIFGPAFLRLLYTYVAPGQSITYAPSDDPIALADDPQRLVAAEEGCR